MKQVISLLILFLALPALNGCTSTTTAGEVGANRRQLLLVPEAQIEEQSAQAYLQTEQEAQKKGQLDRNPEQVRRVRTVAQRLIPATSAFRSNAGGWKWEEHVITSPEVNAYCMPGGKINVYSGLIEKLQLTDGELAAVMGHEISHALREHGRERMSQELIRSGAIQVLEATGQLNPKYDSLAQIGTQFAMLHYSRQEESEADEMGLELMARAGYDPHEALNLWKKMASMGGSKPPELLSDHPADETRFKDLERLIPRVMPLYHPH